MDNNQTQKMPKVTSKSFMTIGPTLHYSHKNVQTCWTLAVLSFVLCCLFWSKIQTGLFWSFSLGSLTFLKFWRLGDSVISPISIFEFPWQILVLGLLMGLLAIIPILISQLLSFSYSLVFILSVFFLANLPILGACLVISCIAAACRPLRFRSRFIAIALCMAPELLYWAFLGGAADVEPVKWGFSFTPWVCAWLVSLIIAALVLGIGHFTRYRPGLVWIFTLVFLIAAVVLFETAIGFAELDYQLYVARNNPEKAAEFHDHSITEALDKRLTDPTVRKYLAGFFYPTEPIALRGELKNEIQIQLSQGRWPSWFMVPKELDFEAKRRQLAERYELFIRRRPKSNRMPIALYYKAILNEYRPDINILGQKEILHFYSDYPHESAREIWYRLYRDFGNSPESLEGRVRIAKHWAGQGRFSQAAELVSQTQTMVTERLKLLRQKTTVNHNLFGLFRPPAASAITEFELEEIQRKLDQLQILISGENHTEDPSTGKRLAKFVMLNPHSRAFAFELNQLLRQMNEADPLRDNVLLAQIKLVADEQLRAEKLEQLYAKFPNTDGGIEALYELGLLEIYLWRQRSDLNPEQKKKYLAKTRATLARFIELYPKSIFAEQVKKNLDGLPGVE